MASQKIKISINEVESGMLTAEFISVYNEKGINVISVPPNTILSHYTIDRMKRFGVKEVQIFVDLPSTDTRPKIIPPFEVPPVKPVIDDKLRETAVSGIRDLFDLAQGESVNMTTAYQVVKDLDNVVDELVDTISSEDPNSIVQIADLKSYDEYTYHHSLSVAVLAIAIGQKLGFNKEQLKKLGQCAIMHDIGKMTVPNELINKKGRLTDKEFKIVQDHAINSARFLKQNNIGDTQLWIAVAHHHEKVNGKGYPNGLRGDKIPIYSQIIAVADVYDAVTSYRSYRAPMPPAEAIEFIMSEVSTSFEYNIVKAFVEKLEPYPLNSIVELSDGRRGVVVDNTKDSMRVVLKMIDDGSLLDLMGLDNLTLMITAVHT